MSTNVYKQCKKDSEVKLHVSRFQTLTCAVYSRRHKLLGYCVVLPSAADKQTLHIASQEELLHLTFHLYPSIFHTVL